MPQKLPTYVTGKTKPFSGDGRRLGYPTANIDSAVELIDGIYFGFADLGPYKDNPSLIFIGKPLTHGSGKRRVEAHLLDVDDMDYYGLKLGLKIRHFHRPNQKFSSENELLSYIQKDEDQARKWFAENTRSL